MRYPNRMARSPVVREVMDEFRKLVQILRSSHRAAENINITGAQLFVLSILAESPAPMSIGAIAERTQTDSSTVSVVAARLMESGLVKRGRSPHDGRRTELSLTAKGRALRKRAPVTVAQRRLADALQELSARDIAALHRTLGAILTSMGVDTSTPVGMMFDDRETNRRRLP